MMMMMMTYGGNHLLVVAGSERENIWIPVDVDYVKEMHQ